MQTVISGFLVFLLMIAFPIMVIATLYKNNAWLYLIVFFLGLLIFGPFLILFAFAIAEQLVRDSSFLSFLFTRIDDFLGRLPILNQINGDSGIFHIACLYLFYWLAYVLGKQADERERRKMRLKLNALPKETDSK